MSTKKRAVIASYVRTPFTRANKGELKDTRPDDMAAMVIAEAVERAGVEPGSVQDVVLGCAMPEAEQGMNVARIAAVAAGLPDTVPGMTINRFCSSGVQTIATVANQIMVGSIDIAVAGGTETMSMIPMGGNKVSANPTLMEENPEIYTSMGATAELVAEKFEVPREKQDAAAARSQQRAAEAWEKNLFANEVMAVTTTVYGDDGPQEVTVSKDTILRPGTTEEGLAKLRPVFKPKGGTVTAGNASPLTDGAAAVVVMSEEKAEELGIEPMGWFHDLQVVGVPPEIMGVGPAYAIPALLEKHGLSTDDIDVYEINEAFGSQFVYCGEKLGLDFDKVNPNGGAIALGHPLGVTGTRLAGTLLLELNRRGGKWGVVSMCIGGGMGAAALFEANPNWTPKS